MGAGGVRELVVGVDDSQLGTDNRSIPRADVASVLVSSLEYPAYQNRSFDVRSKPEGEGTVTSDFEQLLTDMTDNCDYTLGRIPGSERTQQKRRIKKDEDTTSRQHRHELLTSILKVAAATGRGEYGTPAQKATALDWITQLEQLNPTVAPTSATQQDKLHGRWELVYSSTTMNDFSDDEDNTAATPTSYKTVSADLGFLQLLGGFNDAITKFYI